MPTPLSGTQEWQLGTGTELTAPDGLPTGRTDPPATVAQRLAARNTTYGAPFAAPIPLPLTAVDGTPIPGGQITWHSAQLFWHSNIGEIDPGAIMPPNPPTPGPTPPTSVRGSAGSRGLDGIGISAHRIYEGSTLIWESKGNKTTTTLEVGRLLANRSGWTPGSSHTVTITALGMPFPQADGTNIAPVESAKSTAITFTLAAAPTAIVAGAWRAPTDLQLVMPVPPAQPSTGRALGPLTLQWKAPGPLLSDDYFEIYDNNPTSNFNRTVSTSPGANGLLTGDHLVATISPPFTYSGGYIVGATTAAVGGSYGPPGMYYNLKVRMVRPSVTTQSYSPFTPPLSGRLAQAVSLPGQPTVSVGGSPLTITITPAATSSSVGPAAQWQVVDSGDVKRSFRVSGAQLTVPLNWATAGQAYSITVTAVNSVGSSTASTAATGTVLAPAPANFRLNGSVTQTTVPVQWDPVPGATSYKVYEGASTVKATVTAPTVTASAAGYSAAGAYNLTVVSVNAGGESAKSTALTGTTAA